MLSYLVKLAQDSEISASNMGDEEQKSLKELTPPENVHFVPIEGMLEALITKLVCVINMKG